jgi:flagellin-like hook-associated protein FlgL
MTNLHSDYLTRGALQTLNLGVREATKYNEQLSTGVRIHSASDDAARLAIGNKLMSQQQGVLQATSNLHDGISLTQTAEAVLGSITEVFQRMRELAVQAATGTLTNADRSHLDSEYQNLKVQALNTVETTTWNGHRLFSELSPTSFELQAGPNPNDKITVTIPQIYASGALVGFANGDFESDAVGDTSVTGWTVGNNRVTLDGQSQIGGWPTPTDLTKPASSGGDTVPMNSGTFNTQIVTADNPLRGSKSLQLESTNANVASGYGIIHGPYIISNDSTPLKTGETVSFDWRAQGGQDSYDVYAYLLNVDNGSTINLLNETGSSSSWATKSLSMPENSDGNYKFVFVSGTYDETGGRALGARLLVDNITAPPRAIATLNGTNITSATSASSSITEIDLNIQSVTSARASLGASVNRIIHATDYLAELAVQLANSRSQMIDTDYAETSSDLARVQSLDVGATYVLKQLRQNSQNSINMIRSNDNLFKG